MQHRHAFDQVGQLAHVARPGIGAQRLQRFVGETHFATAGAGQLHRQGGDQRRQVVQALAQGGHLDREHVEAVEQILAEVPFGDAVLQVAVGRGDHPHVAADGLVAAHALETALLQHAQQLDLHRQAHVADFIQQQRAALGHLEAALARAERASEGTLLVAEQFAFQQVRRNRAAVDGHERAIAARRMFVDGARHHFLAGAGFAQHQHGGIERGDLVDQPAQAHHRRAVAGRAVALRGLGLVFGIQALEAGAAQAAFQLAVADRRVQRPHPGLVQAVGIGEAGRFAVQQQHRRRQRHVAQPGEEGAGRRAFFDPADDHGHEVVRPVPVDVDIAGFGRPARGQVHELQQIGHPHGAGGIGVEDEDSGFTHGGRLGTFPGWAALPGYRKAC